MSDIAVNRLYLKAAKHSGEHYRFLWDSSDSDLRHVLHHSLFREVGYAVHCPCDDTMRE